MTNATLIAHSGARVVTMRDLAGVPTPGWTRTWHPVSHVEVVRTLTTQVKEMGWKAGEPRIAMSENTKKLFGVMDVNIPGVKPDADYAMAIGFRHSHDKTIGLQFCMGQHVFVCDNLAFSGEDMQRKEHVSNLSLVDEIKSLLVRVKDKVGLTRLFYDRIRATKVDPYFGTTLLTECVARKVLHPNDLIPCREALRNPVKEGPLAIKHVDRLWGVYQAVTATWKGRWMALTDLSKGLNKLTCEVLDDAIKWTAPDRN